LDATKRINVAIDGPAGAGKSTVARLVAGRLGLTYVDTGAMYRAIACLLLRMGISPDDAEAAGRMAETIDLRLETNGEDQRVIANGVDVTPHIRTPEVSAAVPRIARIERVREILVQQQKALAARGGVVMDGRDIGTTVLPDADVKIFLTASVEERARRRYEELKRTQLSDHVTLEQLTREIAARDDMDRSRPVSPLRQAEDAIVVDTTHLGIDEVVDIIVSICRQRLEKE
jgi:cytidylate kinase